MKLSLRAAVGCVLLAIGLTLPTAANASKQTIDFFGGDGALGGEFNDPQSVAVNDSGAGPANAGDVYAIDSGSPSASGNRIQRFGRDDNGTPGNTPAATADDTYFFISAWGADVALPAGGSDYEICTVAEECQRAVASGGNGTAAGNGSLDFTSFNAGEIAVDQDTGNVFVTDSDNNRVSVYDGTGVFLRSFGFDVAASGPGNTGSGYEVCVAADGDVCKAGVSGAGTGQIGAGPSPSAGARSIAVSAPDGNPLIGTVFLADSTNHRVNTYGLDGSGPSSIGSAAVFADGDGRGFPRRVAVDSRGILYADNEIDGGFGGASNDRPILRYDTADANRGGIGFLAPLRSSISENQRLIRNATAGQYRLTFNGDTTADLAFDATHEQVDAALEARPSIGAGNVAVGSCGCAEAYYTIRFTNDLANADVSQLVVSNGTTPLTGTIDVTTIFDGFGGGGANEVQESPSPPPQAPSRSASTPTAPGRCRRRRRSTSPSTPPLSLDRGRSQTPCAPCPRSAATSSSAKAVPATPAAPIPTGSPSGTPSALATSPSSAWMAPASPAAPALRSPPSYPDSRACCRVPLLRGWPSTPIPMVSAPTQMSFMSAATTSSSSSARSTPPASAPRRALRTTATAPTAPTASREASPSSPRSAASTPPPEMASAAVASTSSTRPARHRPPASTPSTT